MAMRNLEKSLKEAVLQIYLKPLEKIIERRASYYLHLSEKDLFSMSEKDAQFHQVKMQELGEEIEALDNIKSAIEDLSTWYAEAVHEVEKDILNLSEQLYQRKLDLITTQQCMETASQWEAFLLQKLLSLDPLIYCKIIPSPSKAQHA